MLIHSEVLENDVISVEIDNLLSNLNFHGNTYLTIKNMSLIRLFGNEVLQINRHLQINDEKNHRS